MIGVEHYLLLAAALFCVGLFGILTRRNALMFLMSVELMVNAAAINLIAFAVYYGNLTGQVFTLFVLALAAAEVAVGLGIIMVLHRNYGEIDVTVPSTMRW